jgi:DNA-binding cell septation regulator SpoVG
MEIKDVKEINKGAIKLVFAISFPQVQITVRDFKLMESKNGLWVSPPSREYQDGDGKKKYYPFFAVADAHKDLFQKTCLELLQPFINKAPVTKEDITPVDPNNIW